MKRLFALLLVAALLSGCVSTPTEPTTEPTMQPTTEPTQPSVPTLYDPDSDLEQSTGGAVRAYSLSGYCDGMILVGGRVVLYYRDEQTQFKLYSGEELRLDGTATNHVPVPADNGQIQATKDSVRYFDQSTNTLVFLGADLQQRYRLELPDSIQGSPVVNSAMDAVYFCTQDGIRVMDISVGIAHMLRQQADYNGVLIGSCFDGELLVCSVTDAEGRTATDFISAETGLSAGKGGNIRWIDSVGKRYLLELDTEEGAVYLFGSRDGEVSQFRAGEGQVYSALARNGALVLQQTGDGWRMDLFDLDSGLRTASVVLPGVQEVRNVAVDEQGYIWFLTEARLCRWDPSGSPVSDETVYTAPWQSGGQDDETGLAQIKTDAEVLEQQYGLDIRIGEDAVQAPWDNMTAEYRVQLLSQALEEMESVFSLFPEGMLAELGTVCDSGAVCVSVVADTGAEMGQQTWADGNAYIAVETGDSFRQELLRTLYRVMDTYVLNKNSILDEWNAEKPAEDRARFFVEALTPDNGDFFASYTAQEKLYDLCNAIRRAFGMRYYEAELPWEQYLDDPLYD